MHSYAVRVILCPVFAASSCAIAPGNIYRAGIARFRQSPGYLYQVCGSECGCADLNHSESHAANHGEKLSGEIWI